MSVLALLNTDGDGFTVFVSHERAKFYDGKDLEWPRERHKSGYIMRLNAEESATYASFLAREQLRHAAAESRFNPGDLKEQMFRLWKGRHEPLQ